MHADKYKYNNLFKNLCSERKKCWHEPFLGGENTWAVKKKNLKTDFKNQNASCLKTFGLVVKTCGKNQNETTQT